MTIEATKFEDAYKFSQDAFKELEGKEGFELYQTFRDALFHLIFDKNDGGQKFVNPAFNNGELVKLNLVDQKYIDNFVLCMAIRLNAPNDYEELKIVIDKNIIPDKRSQGMAHIYKEMSGALLLFLSIYENISARQADQLVSQLFGLAQNVPHTQYLKQRKNIKLTQDVLPNDYTLALLFFGLQKREININDLKPIVENNKRSEDEFEKAVNGYLYFRKRIFDSYVHKIKPLFNKDKKTILPMLENEFNLNFGENDNPSDFDVLIVICISLGMEIMPNFIYHPEKFIEFLQA